MVGLQPGLPSYGSFWELLEKVPSCGTTPTPVSPTPAPLCRKALKEITGPFSCFGSFAKGTSPPVSALGRAGKWKILSFLPCVLHYYGPFPVMDSAITLLSPKGQAELRYYADVTEHPS